MRRFRLGCVLVLLGVVVAYAAQPTHATWNDGKPGTQSTCEPFDDDSQGSKCAEFCARLKRESKDESPPYCMCLPGPCGRTR